MLKLIIPAAIAFGLLFPLSASAQSVQYVGNSGGGGADRRSGGAGILEFNEECVAIFGDGARMCTSLEIMQTLQTAPDAATPIPVREDNGVRQWVAPAIVAGSSSGVDASGLTGTASALTCNGWSSQSSTLKGLTMDDFGRFSLQTCNGTRQIACCQAVP